MDMENGNQTENAVTDDAALEEAAARAAISESRGEDLPASPQEHVATDSTETQTQGTHEDSQPTDAPQGDSPSGEPTAPGPAMYFGLTEDQVKVALAKAGNVDKLEAQLRNAFGRLGEMNSRLQALQKSEQAGSIPSGSLEKVEEVVTKYHEALLDGDMETATKLYKQSLAAMPHGSMPDGFKPEDIDARVSQALTAQQVSVSKMLLSFRHPDWETIRDSEDFNRYLHTLSPEQRHQVVNSNDPLDAANNLDKFKDWRKAREEAANQQNQRNQNRQQRLTNAVTPSGSAPADQPIITEEEAAKAAIRQRLQRA